MNDATFVPDPRCPRARLFRGGPSSTQQLAAFAREGGRKAGLARLEPAVRAQLDGAGRPG